MKWFEQYYRGLMLIGMLLEIFFVGVIAVFEVLSYFRHCGPIAQ